MKRQKLVVQNHHIRYPDDPKGEWVVRLTRGEHLVLTLLNRHTVNVSLGFIEGLQDWLLRNVEKAKAL